MAAAHYVYEADAWIDIGDHVFPIDKYPRLFELLQSELGVTAERIHGWDVVEDEDLERVHMPRYLADLAAVRQTDATLSSELPVESRIIEGFRRMVGGSIATTRLALEHGVGFHVGGGFHHAFPGHAEGFCFLHDMAIAVEWARAHEGLGNVLFVDVDVHQGNGSAVIYADDRETFTYSIHQERNYPIKQRSDLDRGLQDGVADDEYLERLSDDLDAIDQRFSPELICYVAGVDPHVQDVLGGLALSDSGIARRDRLVLERYVSRDLPVAIFLAGGYSLCAEQTAILHLSAARAAEAACQRDKD